MSAQKYYESFHVAGAVNSEQISGNFISPQSEHRYVEGVYLYLSALNGNHVNVYLEREKLAEIRDQVIGSNHNPEYTFWPLDIDLPVGQALTFSIVSGGNTEDLDAVVRYRVS